VAKNGRPEPKTTGRTLREPRPPTSSSSRLLGTTCLGYSASFGGSGDIPKRWPRRSCFYFNPTSALAKEAGCNHRIHHVGLPVSDLDRSVAWYREALGLTHESTAGVPEGVAFMVAPTGERLELLAVDPQPSAWDGPIAALRAGVPHIAWTVDDLDAAHARAVEAGGRSVWTPRDTPEPGLRIAFVADPDGNLVELLSSDEEAPPT
jgi:lactoylglutathione lyase